MCLTTVPWYTLTLPITLAHAHTCTRREMRNNVTTRYWTTGCPKKRNNTIFRLWALFCCFLTFWWPQHHTRTLLNINLCSNDHFIIISIRIDWKGFEKPAIWPNTPDWGGYGPSQNYSLFWNSKNPFDQFQLVRNDD